MRLLVSFSRVARLGSMSLAAADLGYVPSAISQHVTALEHSIGGTPLFTRKAGSRLTLTAAGRALADAADELLRAAASFRDVAHGVSQGEGVALRIGAYGTALSHLLPGLLSKLVATDPCASIQTVEIEPVDGLPLLERGELDVLVAHRYLPEDLKTTPNTTMTPLGHEPLLLTHARASSLDGAPPLSIDDCKAHDWVAGGVRDADRRLLHRWTATLGFEPAVRHETRDYHTAVELIASGLAVGLLPASVVGATWLRGRLSVIDLPAGTPIAEREIMAITRKGFHIPPVAELLDRLSELLASRHGQPSLQRTLP